LNINIRLVQPKDYADGEQLTREAFWNLHEQHLEEKTKKRHG